MKIVVIGLGSMGKRRIRLIKKIDESIEIFGVDENFLRCQLASSLYKITTFTSLEEAKLLEGVECAFICTSPLSHASIIEECLKSKWNVFSELNLVADKYEENMILAKDNNCVLYLSSTLFYRDEITYIRQCVSNKKKLNYIYHIGQYLPNWHPWENYKDFFIGNRRTNGCREIMAVELPWLIDTFGDVIDFHVISDKITKLNINYNDNYMIQLVHKSGNKGVLVVDVVSPEAVRNLEIYGENIYLRWDGTPNTLMEYKIEKKEIINVELISQSDHLQGYSSFIIENAYQNEIKDFFDVVAGIKEQQYGFEKDLKILKFIDKIEGVE